MNLPYYYPQSYRFFRRAEEREISRRREIITCARIYRNEVTFYRPATVARNLTGSARELERVRTPVCVCAFSSMR